MDRTKTPPFQALQATPEHLRAFLDKHNMTAQEFATHCGVTRGSVYNWLQSRPAPKPWVGVIMGWLEYVKANHPEQPSTP